MPDRTLAIGFEVSVTLDGLIVHSVHVREGEDRDVATVERTLTLGRYRLELRGEQCGDETRMWLDLEEVEMDDAMREKGGM